MAGRAVKRAQARADAKSDNGAAPKRVMPANYHWLTLAGPTDLAIAKGEEDGTPPFDFSGWTFEVNRSVKLGMLSEAMRALTAAGEIEAKASDEQADDDAVMETSEVEVLGSAYAAMIEFCAAHTRAWDFVDEVGEPIPYSEQAWRNLDQQLIVACFRALTQRVTSAPKAKSATPTR